MTTPYANLFTISDEGDGVRLSFKDQAVKDGPAQEVASVVIARSNLKQLSEMLAAMFRGTMQ